MKQRNSSTMKQTKSRNLTDQPLIKVKRGRPFKERNKSEIDQLSRRRRGRPPGAKYHRMDMTEIQTQITTIEEHDSTQSEVLKLCDLFICAECDAMFRSEDRLRSHVHLHQLLKSLISLNNSFHGRNVNQTFSSTSEDEVTLLESCNVIGQCVPGGRGTSSRTNISNGCGDLSTSNNSNIDNTKVVSSDASCPSDVKMEVTSFDSVNSPDDPDDDDDVQYGGFDDGSQIPDEASVALNHSSTVTKLTCDDELSDGVIQPSYLLRNLLPNKRSNTRIKHKKIKKAKAIVKVDMVEDKKIIKQESIVKIEGVEMYSCYDCERTFSQYTHLSVHHRVHTGERPFKCGRCDYSFNVRSNLVVHLRKNVCTRRKSLEKKDNNVSKINKRVPITADGNDKDVRDAEKDDDDNGDDKYRKSVHYAVKKNHCKAGRKRKGVVKIEKGVEVLKANESADQIVQDAVSTVGSKRIVKVESIPDNVQSHSSKRWPCQYCARMFLCAAHVEVHERVHTGVRPYVCLICSRPFSVASNLRTHIRAKHPDSVSVFITKRQNKQRCGGKISTKNKSNSIPARQDCKVGYETTAVISESDDVKKRYVCYICHATFRHAESVIRHVARHLGAPSPRFTYTCVVCDRSCASNANLEIHMRRHTRERPFTCDVCGRSFAQSSHIRSHLRTHDDVAAHRDYVCDICGASYRRNYALKRHQRSSHPTDGIKIACEICDCAIASKCGLTKHMNIYHSARPFVCMQCGRGYDNAVKLAEHELRHSVPKMHTCRWCSKRYSFPGDLRKHIRVCHHNVSQLGDASDVGSDELIKIEEQKNV